MHLRANRSKTEVDRLYLQLAFDERENSDDPKAKRAAESGVGAVIVKDGIVVSKSANVLPPALKGARVAEGAEVVDEADRYYFIEHAERAAIFRALKACEPLEGSTLYCTRFPCSDCARAIAWAGIERVVVASGYAGESRWLAAQRAAARILRGAGIVVRVLNSPRQRANAA